MHEITQDGTTDVDAKYVKRCIFARGCAFRDIKSILDSYTFFFQKPSFYGSISTVLGNFRFARK